jgi:tetraacyldisaccharide 4'-kinase
MAGSVRSALSRAVVNGWTRRGPLACALWPLSRLYGALVALHRARYRSVQQRTRLPVPVIVVGNVVAGGAGKTPTTLALVQHLQVRGWRPGILSRGHGRDTGDCREVQPASDPRQVGDEPLLLRRRAGVPVFVAARRAEAGRALLAAHPGTDILVCDDGLQHLALARDVEICVFDARGIGNGWLLPAGPLREPWPRAVDLVLHTEAGGDVALPAGASAHRAQRALAEHARRADGARVALADLRDQRLAAVAGIARPQAFFDMLRAAGLPLGATVALPDHAAYDEQLAAALPPGTLLCTEKDALKLWRHRPDALAVPLQLDVPPAFFAALDERLAARGYHPRNPAGNPADTRP